MDNTNMSNRDKIELLRQLHNAIAKQLCDIIEAGKDSAPYENMPLYTLGIGGVVFSFPATLIYGLMFENLFKSWDELKDDSGAGVEGATSMEEDLNDAIDMLSELMNDPDNFVDPEDYT